MQTRYETNVTRGSSISTPEGKNNIKTAIFTCQIFNQVKVTRLFFFKEANFSFNRVSDPVDLVLARALTFQRKLKESLLARYHHWIFGGMEGSSLLKYYTNR